MPRKKSPAKSSLPKTKSPTAAAKYSKTVREYWENLTWSDITDHFGTKTTQRGRDYAESGQVETLWATEDGKKLVGIVQGTEEYQTIVSLEKSRRKTSFIPVSVCSCPVGIDCKHGVAVIGTFLEILAENKPILGCTELKDGVWETTSPTGKKSTLKIETEDDFYDDDEEDWDDAWAEEDDDLPPPKRIRRTTKGSSADRNFKPETLRKSLSENTSEELVDLVMQLVEDHPAVRKQFEQQMLVESASKSGKADRIVEKAIEMIDQGVDLGGFGYYGEYDDGYYGGGPSADLDSVTELVKQCGKITDPLPTLDKIARHLLKKGGRFLEATGAEDDYEFREVLDAVAKVLLGSKSDPVKIVLWAYEMDGLDQFAMVDDMEKTLLSHPWSAKVWSDVADNLLIGLKKKSAETKIHRQLERIISALDKGKRKNEATDLLRKEAPKRGEHKMLVDRLMEVDCLDEAEKIIVEQLRKRLPSVSKSDWDDLVWMRKLIIVAERRKDWPALVSIRAAEFFHEPSRKMIMPLLKAAKTLKVEPAIRRGIDTFLRNGELPAAVSATLSGRKPSSSMKKAWPIPVFFFQPKPDSSGFRYDVLCEWAIAEKRNDDVIRWFDELKKISSQKRKVNVFEVAEAVLSSHPNRSFEIYRKAAEEEMSTASTSHYPIAISHLRKAKQALEKAKRDREWSKIIEDIREKHRRKTNLMKLLDELEAGSIVKQKRR